MTGVQTCALPICIGFTWEVDCHLFYKRSRELGLSLGPQRTWKDKLVSQLELSNAA